MANISQDIGNAEFYAHRYDEQASAFRFIPLAREQHRECTFITDEYLPENLPVTAIPRGDIAAADVPTAPMHFIFHSAYCCSTLLARAFDIPGTSMGLKEPVILNDIIGWRRRGADGPNATAALDQGLRLLSRPFEGDKAVIVKPSNIVTPLAKPILEMRPDARALLLYAPLKSYLRSIAKKDMWGRLWVREVFIGTLKDGYAVGGFNTEELLSLTDLQIAAIGWLSQHALFADIAATFGKDRVRIVDSETLLARPGDVMEALVRLFGMELDERAIADIVAGPAFTRHSKFDGEFSGEDRAKEQRDAAAVHGEEIEMVAKWAEAVADSQNMAINLQSAQLLK